MSQLSIPPLDNQCYSFYVQEIAPNVPLEKLRFQPHLRIDFTRENLTANYSSLFSRPVVYLPLTHQNELSDIIAYTKGLNDYLKGCAALFKLQDLMQFIPKERIGHHKQDLQGAFTLLIKSANDHFPCAQYLIGYCYLHGFRITKKNRIDKNQEIAIKWFQSAATHGHLLSIHCLREMTILPTLNFEPTLNPPQLLNSTTQPNYVPQAKSHEEYEILMISLIHHNQTLFSDNAQLRRTISDLTQRIIYLESTLNLISSVSSINQTPTLNDPDMHNITAEENEPKRQRITHPFFD